MPAKRLVPVLHVLEGRIVDSAGADLGLPAPCARRLEMEGADEILFVEKGRGRRLRQAWMGAVAGGLFIPFGLEAPFEDEAEVAEALEDCAGKVVLPARNLGAFRPFRFGRTRIVATLEGAPAPDWQGTLDAISEAAQAGAGQVLLSAGTQALGDLFLRASHLPLPVLLRCADPALAAEALVHGADGIVFPGDLRTASEFKALLAETGLAFRH